MTGPRARRPVGCYCKTSPGVPGDSRAGAKGTAFQSKSVVIAFPGARQTTSRSPGAVRSSPARPRSPFWRPVRFGPQLGVKLRAFCGREPADGHGRWSPDRATSTDFSRFPIGPQRSPPPPAERCGSSRALNLPRRFSSAARAAFIFGPSEQLGVGMACQRGCGGRGKACDTDGQAMWLKEPEGRRRARRGASSLGCLHSQNVGFDAGKQNELASIIKRPTFLVAEAVLQYLDLLGHGIG